MPYQALARKWRPRTFEQVVGQDHVTRALSNALANDRVHPAMLFAGTRGVGKTTLGRIIAKCLNCETGVSATPCGTCDACTGIDQGRFVDLIEIDAASRTKVDDTRELLDNVQYAPTRGRVKVYLIDEVHMLSKHSFNALLKTLEEPPPHVRFLLATTDPQKLPITILSRCLQFNLKRLSPTLIRERLAMILAEEGVDAESDALQALAIAADGSMRDSLSLTDQAIAFAGGALTRAVVDDMLGSVGAQDVLEIIDVVAQRDPDAMAALLRRLDDQAPDFDGLLVQLAAALQQVAVAQLVPAYENPASVFDVDVLRALGERLLAEDVQLYYQIATHGRRDLPVAPDPRAGFEMTLLRMMAFTPNAQSSGAGRAGGSGGEAQQTDRAAQLRASRDRQRGAAASAESEMPPPAAGVAEDHGPAATATGDSAIVEPSPHARPADARTDDPGPADDAAADDWSSLVRRAGLSGLEAQLARNAQCTGLTPQAVDLRLPPECTHLNRASTVQRLQASLRQATAQADLVVRVQTGAVTGPTVAQAQADAAAAEQAAARDALAADENIAEFQRRFGAQVREDSIRPLPAAPPVTQSRSQSIH